MSGLAREEKAQTSCVLRLFGASALSVQQAAAALPETWQLTVQCRSRGAESLIALCAKTADGLKKGRESLRACFAADLYGEGEKGLADAVVQALERNQKLLVCGDAATGALLETRLENVPGAEKVFDFGSMSYADAKVSAQIEKQVHRKAKSEEPVLAAMARVRAVQHLVGAELAAACAEAGQAVVLLLGTRKGCWVRTVYEEETPGLWLLDMIRRAACGLPQAEGTHWQSCREPIPQEVLQPIKAGQAPPAAPPPKRKHRLRNLLLVLVLLAAAALAAGWYYTGGDLTALPRLLRTDGVPHSGARLL